MHACAAAGSAFLMAVLWFDLMFDIQTFGHKGETLPPKVLASIGAYYRRVTTEARPMGQLVSLVMLATLAAIVAEYFQGDGPVWRAAASLAMALIAIGLAVGRTVRNAVRLGGGQGSLKDRSRLARSIYRDHLVCIVAMTAVAGLQLLAN